MSTGTDRRELAGLTMAFAKGFDAWVRRAAEAYAGESAPRLQLLNELHCNGPKKMADLAETLSVTPRAVTALVDGLEAEHLVKRSAHPTDRRITMVEIQPAGSATVEQGFGAFQTAVDDLFAGLGDSEVAALRGWLGTITQRLEVAPVEATRES